MTQKELLYIEDAIGHEQNIIKILDYSINNLDDDSLIKFLKTELKSHETYKAKLIKLLEGISHE